MGCMPDVQSNKPSVEICLDKVCVHNAYKRIYIYHYKSFMGLDELPVIFLIKDSLWRNGKEEVTIGVKAKGMTVCPCAQQVYAYMEKLQSQLPHVPSHSQRALASVFIVTKPNNNIDLAKLTEVVLNSFSAPVLNYLKRDSEYKLVKQAFENPKFVEDVARDLIFNVYETFNAELHDDDKIVVKVVSYESIHPFNLYAFSLYRVGELRKLLSGQ